MRPMKKNEMWPPERIKALRKRFGEKQYEFCTRLGISLGTLKVWETKGGVPLIGCKLLEHIEKIAPKAELVHA